MAFERCRVLVVEDNSQFRRRIRRKYLSRCDVTEVSDGTGFSATLAARPFHVILMDYQLPFSNGEELVRLARDQQYHGAIVAISSSEHYNRLLLQAGADTAVLKREAYLLPGMIRQGLSMARARWGTAGCDYQPDPLS